ncbi:hypothetical protein GCM10017778_32290 [Streptomyces vinaceus]|nr:hypothetical protein GCM10017778_32290 [Streptomyces vinaceus]
MSDSPRRDRKERSGSTSADVRERLAADRADKLARMAALGRDYDGIVAANALVAVDDEHDPEGRTTACERAHSTSLLMQARRHLEELDRALERLARRVRDVRKLRRGDPARAPGDPSGGDHLRCLRPAGNRRKDLKWTVLVAVGPSGPISAGIGSATT